MAGNLKKKYSYLCWRKLSCRLKYFPQTSHENVTSGLLWVRSCIIKLYDFVKRLWQCLQINSHFGRILRRKSDRQSSLSIRITANIVICFGGLLFSLSKNQKNLYEMSWCCVRCKDKKENKKKKLLLRRSSLSFSLFKLVWRLYYLRFYIYIYGKKN